MDGRGQEKNVIRADGIQQHLRSLVHDSEEGLEGHCGENQNTWGYGGERGYNRTKQSYWDRGAISGKTGYIGAGGQLNWLNEGCY